jgi:hypothetical protein
MGLAGYGPVPEPGYYFEFYANTGIIAVPGEEGIVDAPTFHPLLPA